MDVFRILSRGASLKKNKEETTDYVLPSEAQRRKETNNELVLKSQIDTETDFFNTKRSRNRKPEIKQVTHEPREIVPPKISNETDAQLFRKTQKSKVTGYDVPFPIGSFEDLISRFQIDQGLLDNLLNSGFVEPTAIQSESIPIILNNRDLISCAPTGSGKTLAYLIPLLHKLVNEPAKPGIKALIIAPTNELASQIHTILDMLCKKKLLRTSILSKQLASKLINKDIKSDKIDILVATPLRLIDLLKKEAIDLSKVANLIIDEADKLFDQGFLGQTDEILASLTNVKLNKAMFSATIPSGVEEIARSIMLDPIRVIVGHKEAANEQIEQRLVFTGNEEGKLIAIRQLIQESEFKPPIIIFLQSITRAKALFHELLYDRLNVDVIHSERTAKQRDEVIERFKNGDVWVLITTDVIARGIDFKGVNLVINYDVPQTAQTYVHRIGRTGRGGKNGKAITFFTKEDSIAIKPIINVMKQSGCESGYSSWMENINKLSKNQKNKIKHQEISRKKISTVPQVIRKKRKQREEMIAASKRRKDNESLSK